MLSASVQDTFVFSVYKHHIYFRFKKATASAGLANKSQLDIAESPYSTVTCSSDHTLA